MSDEGKLTDSQNSLCGIRLKWSSIEDLLNALNLNKGKIEVYIRALHKPPKNMEEIIVLKYIETRRVDNARLFAGKIGFRVASDKSGEKLPDNNDIKSLFLSQNKKIDPVIQEIAKQIFRINKKKLNNISD